MSFRDLAFGSKGDTKWDEPDQGTMRSFGRRQRTAIGEIGYYRHTRDATKVGEDAIASGDRGAAFGANAFSGDDGTTAVGVYSRATRRNGIVIGSSANVSHADSMVFGASAVSSAANQASFGAGSNTDYLNHIRFLMGANGQALNFNTRTELTTIAAAAFTDTAIQIPALVIVMGVSVRTTVAIPTAATYTVTGVTAGTFNTAAVSTAVNSTDPGTAAGAYYNATAQAIRITPIAVPAANTGRVRVTIHYWSITPPTS